MHDTTIGLDLDDTIIDHTEIFRALTQEYGITENVSPADLMTRAFKRHVTPEQYEDIANRAYGEMSLESPPMPEAVETIRKILQSVDNVFIISNRREPRSRYARQWIQEHLPFFPWENAIFTENDADKGPVCERLAVELFLDNKPVVLDHLPQNTTGLLFDPHGAFADNPPYPRITSWRVFEQKILS